MALSVDIRKQLGDFHLEVQFDAGDETLALLGASGCGKSVTLKCVAGILTPDEGRITLDGVTLFDSAARIDLPPQRRHVGYLFQDYALFPNMTVRQNIAAGAKDRGRRRETAEALIRRFRLEDAADRKPRQLSGGQRQRAALARILASEPRAVLLDEPFSALDSYLKYQLELELAEILDSFPGTAVWVSHDRGEVFRNCGRVCVLDAGKSQPVRTLEELFRAPGTEAAARLSGCKNYAGVELRGEAVFVPAWNVTLRCAGPAADHVRTIGVRAHQVRPAPPGTENSFPCAVVRVIEDVFSTVVLLRPEGAAADAPLLRMELDKAAWQAVPDKQRLTAAIPPEDILLLK